MEGHIIYGLPLKRERAFLVKGRIIRLESGNLNSLHNAVSSLVEGRAAACGDRYGRTFHSGEHNAVYIMPMLRIIHRKLPNSSLKLPSKNRNLLIPRHSLSGLPLPLLLPKLLLRHEQQGHDIPLLLPRNRLPTDRTRALALISPLAHQQRLMQALVAIEVTCHKLMISKCPPLPAFFAFFGEESYHS